ncbi:exodeoxyribonuclease V subunit alpha [Caldimonas tepidiphila]|uniref:exodeoxyribonuclease V subunit alpha n=1 Tax=Caldimonas tepidiphila TaxID=2315841 RepID=UPI000E5C0DB6|nr:exodeoxyribonuclease V subunit alpha [Caldimonas tepidiphila]
MNPHRTATLPEDNPAMLALIERWAERGWLRELDAAFARFLDREVQGAPRMLLLAAALASHQLGRGHVCLDLEQTLIDPGLALSLPPERDEEASDEEPLPLPADLLLGFTAEDWRTALLHPELVGSGAGQTPLVCTGHRLYLRRYWHYEQDVRGGIEARLAAAPVLAEGKLRDTLQVVFPHDSGIPGPDWQKLACALAARSAFAIITGGPGTGKTTTVVRLLAVLQAMALDDTPSRPLCIRLAAPTGKAAARLNESIAEKVEELKLDGLPAGDAVRAAIPREVTTLHRLLGSRPDTRHFRHHAGNPLPVDVLVVDEASMVDLEMMAALLDALPPSARLVLIGDKDQLASVEAGAVLGELCRHAEKGRYIPATADWLCRIAGAPIEEALVDPQGSPLDQAVAMLRHSHRFAADRGIGQLAAAVKQGSADAVSTVFSAAHSELARVPLQDSDDAALRRLVIDGEDGRDRAAVSGSEPQGYRHYLQLLKDRRPRPSEDQVACDNWAREVLAAHGRFQVLCALRRGSWGVEGLNRRIAGWLRDEGLIPSAEGWYAGRPVLVTSNDYGLGLMNGDIGITLELPAQGRGSVLRVAFPTGDGSKGIKWIQPSRLQAVETVFALTVHKSQGSEFEHAALVLPDRINPVLTGELVYTGITRAKRWFSLVEAGGSDVLDQSVRRRVLRSSGLRTALESEGV